MQGKCTFSFVRTTYVQAFGFLRHWSPWTCPNGPSPVPVPPPLHVFLPAINRRFSSPSLASLDVHVSSFDPSHASNTCFCPRACAMRRTSPSSPLHDLDDLLPVLLSRSPDDFDCPPSLLHLSMISMTFSLSFADDLRMISIALSLSIPEDLCLWWCGFGCSGSDGIALDRRVEASACDQGTKQAWRWRTTGRSDACVRPRRCETCGGWEGKEAKNVRRSSSDGRSKPPREPNEEEVWRCTWRRCTTSPSDWTHPSKRSTWDCSWRSSVVGASSSFDKSW